MRFKIQFVLLLCIAWTHLNHSKVLLVLQENIEVIEGDQDIWDASGFQYIAESDELVRGYGPVKFLHPVKSPYKAHFYAEKFIRGQWNLEIYNRVIPDFCSVMLEPSEIWYKLFEGQKGCPYEAGVSFYCFYHEV